MGGKTLVGILGLSAFLFSSNDCHADDYISQGTGTNPPLEQKDKQNNVKYSFSNYALLPSREPNFGRVKFEYRPKF